MTRAEVCGLQRDLNRFTRKYLEKVKPLKVDGNRGRRTNSRIQLCKHYIGYTGKAQKSSRVTKAFRRRLDHPKSPDAMPRAMLKRGEKRRVEQRRRAREPAGSGEWGGCRQITNEAIAIVGGRAPVTSRKRTETFGNPGSDHHVSQEDADAVDFGIANAQALMDEIARKLGGPSDVADFQHFFVQRGDRTFRVQIIAVTHGTGPHLHVGVRRH